MISCKDLAHTILKVGKSKICRAAWQADDLEELVIRFECGGIFWGNSAWEAGLFVLCSACHLTG